MTLISGRRTVGAGASRWASGFWGAGGLNVLGCNSESPLVPLGPLDGIDPAVGISFSCIMLAMHAISRMRTRQEKKAGSNQGEMPRMRGAWFARPIAKQSG